MFGILRGGGGTHGGRGAWVARGCRSGRLPQCLFPQRIEPLSVGERSIFQVTGNLSVRLAPALNLRQTQAATSCQIATLPMTQTGGGGGYPVLQQMEAAMRRLSAEGTILFSGSSFAMTFPADLAIFISSVVFMYSWDSGGHGGMR